MSETYTRYRLGGQATVCNLCGRMLGTRYHFSCHLCGAAYCYAHMPEKCDHRKESNPFAQRVRRVIP